MCEQSSEDEKKKKQTFSANKIGEQTNY